MKPLLHIFFLAVLIYLQGCSGCIKNTKNNDQEPASTGKKSKIPVPVATGNLIIKDENDLTGYWAGLFGPENAGTDSVQYDGEDEQFNKINISIDSINGTNVKGHTVIEGKVRFFKCTMEKGGNRYEFTFKGGADEKTDGVYKFSIAKGDSLLTGTWRAGKDDFGHDFSLTKKLFNYNAGWKLQPGNYVDYNKYKTVTKKIDTDTYRETRFATTSDDVEKYNPSADILTKEYVANLKKADFLILRNSIFARHGYTFKKPLLSLYFSQQTWYVPISNDVTAELTNIEKQNLKLMAPYEKNAEEYYNAYGR